MGTIFGKVMTKIPKNKRQLDLICDYVIVRVDLRNFVHSLGARMRTPTIKRSVGHAVAAVLRFD